MSVHLAPSYVRSRDKWLGGMLRLKSLTHEGKTNGITDTECYTVEDHGLPCQGARGLGEGLVTNDKEKINVRDFVVLTQLSG